MAYEDLKDFDLTEHQKMVRESVRRFAEKEISPVVDDYERDGKYPLDLVGRLGKLGFLGPLIPERYGGSFHDHVSYGIVCEELARADWVLGSVVSVQNSLIASSILRFGTDEQRDRYLPGLASGRLLGSACLTEPDAGSDLAALKTTATRAGNGYVLRGSKMFISHAEHADTFFVLATVDRAKKHRGVTAFMVDSDLPGLQIRPIDMHVLRRDSVAEVSFEEVEVGREALLGDEGGGFPLVGSALDTGRFSVAARAVGQAQACIDAMVKYAKERTQFGRPIGEFQMIQQMIADRLTEIEAARLLVYRVGKMKDRNAGRVSMEASMAKLYATEVSHRVATDAVQVHGGYGLAREYPVGRYLLESKVLQIGEGTNQLQRILIAEYALGIRRAKR